jgi:Zn-finger nucleic acid-binding protein
MRCPKCRKVDLKEARVKSSNVKVDSCPQCKGVWLDAGELEAVLSVAAKELAVPPAAQKSAVNFCPRCSLALYRFSYPQTDVKIEMCKNCGGLWLDAGEFREIKAIRQMLEEQGKLDEYARPPGIKGGLLRFIDAAIDELKIW